MNIFNYLKFIFSKTFLINLTIALVLAGTIIWGIFKFIDGYTHHGETISVPSLEGLTIEDTKTVLEEKGLDVIRLLDLKGGYCRVAIGMRDEDELDYNKPDIVVATKMVNITEKFFAEKAISPKLIKLYGSIELAPLVGLADMIVDIVETGTTMKQNGLKVVDTMMESTTHLIANRSSFLEKKGEILELYSKFEDVINRGGKI